MSVPARGKMTCVGMSIRGLEGGFLPAITAAQDAQDQPYRCHHHLCMRWFGQRSVPCLDSHCRAHDGEDTHTWCS